MIRYMITPITGNGSEQSPFRGDLPDDVNVNQRIPTHTSGPLLGQPLYRFAFCCVATPSISMIEQVSNAYVFPDYPLDGLLSGMDQDKRIGMVQSVQAYNWDNEGFHVVVPNGDNDSFRDVITSIGLQIDASFLLAFFGVGEVAA